jgi:hypothetical protein
MRETSLSLWLALVLGGWTWPSVVIAATKVWTGAGADGNWTTAANWATNVPPVAGDILVFPGLVAKKFATNNFPANTLFGGLSLRDAYTLRGAAIDVTNVVESIGTIGTLDLNLRLRSPVTFFSSLGPSTLVLAPGRTVSLNGFDLTFDRFGGDHQINGSITDSAGALSRVVITNNTTVTLNGFNNAPGGTLVTNISSLIVNGSMASAVSVATSSSLGGTGLLQQVSVSGIISPGGVTPGRMVINGPCTLSSTATLSVGIGGTSPGGTYDQLQCGTNLNLGSAHLLITRDASFFPAIGSSFTIISKTNSGAINGTFTGLPQGASTNVGGVFYQISYTGGDGNDVVLTVTNTDTHFWTGAAANNFWSTAGNWDGSIAPIASNNLVFPRTAVDAVCTNDFPVDTVFNSLRFTGTAATNNYPLLRGNSIRLLSGITATNPGSQGTVALELPIKLAAPQIFTNSSTITAVELRSNIVANPFNLTVGGSGLFRTSGRITGTNNANLVQVTGGHLVVNGTLDGNASVTGGGDLAGTGTVGAVSVTNATVSPGDGGAGILNIKGGLSLNSGSTLNIELNNSIVGSGYDQVLVSTGNVSLGSAALNLVVASNLPSVIGNTFTLINVSVPTTTVSGIFAGLPEGTGFTNNGTVFQISYRGGDGNDVVLTLLSVLSTATERLWTGLAATNTWSSRSNWAGNVAPASGDTLHFQSSSLIQRKTNFNDLPVDTTFGTLRFDGDIANQTVFGNPLRLNDGVRLEPMQNSPNLAFPGVITVSNRVTLNLSQTITNAVDGNLRFAGGVVLGNNTLAVNARINATISFDAPITGAGHLQAGMGGRVNLNGSNAITGDVLVSSGMLTARHPQALGTAAAGPVRVGSGAVLRLDSSNAVFTGSLIVVTGRLEVLNTRGAALAAPVLAAGTNAVITGTNDSFSNFSFELQSHVTNNNQLQLAGSTTLHLSSSASFEGGGTLQDIASQFDADGLVHNILLLGGTTFASLTGAGQIDTLICSNFYSLQPGSSTDSTRAFDPLRVGRLVLSASRFASVSFVLFPNRPGGGATNQSLITSSAPDLGGVGLTLIAATNLSPGQKFMLLRNDSAAPITNTFANLPEGAFLAASNGNLGLQISYRGGDGNDLVITVQSNTPPQLSLVNQTVNEETTLIFTNSAVDFDRPPQRLTWGLLSAPGGVILNPTNGVITWTPAEEDGPSTNSIVLKVVDSGMPPQSSTGTVTVIVQEVNKPPLPVPIPLTNVILGNTLTLQLAATDADKPTNSLTWFAPVLPPEATLSSNGLFTFTPTTNVPGTRIFPVSVRDFNPDAVNAKSLTNTLTLSLRIDILRMVTNTFDSGPGSLRQAILDVNTNAGGGRIEFNIPGAGPFKIFLITALPTIVHDTVIDGYTQPGAHPNTLINSDNATPLIELSGENITTPTNGLSWSGARVTLRGLIINRWDTALAVGKAGAAGLTSNAVVEGCFIGTDPTGTQRRTNRVGISLFGAAGARIGGPGADQRNLISGSSQAGISLAWDNVNSFLHNLSIQNNFIGTDRAGTNGLGNGAFGVLFQSNLPTTNSSIADNVICANSQGGLQLAGARNFVKRNKIGVGADGVTALGNGGPGVELFGSQYLVGGNEGADANLVFNNNGPGVHVSAGTNNFVSGNSIFRNSGLGIDLGNLGPDANDLGDLDSGANNLQNTPALASNIVADSSSVIVNGSLASAVLTTYRLEFFHSPDFQPSGQPQARTFLGSTTVTTDGNGNANFSVMPVLPSIGGFISATATDPAGNTSEISPPTGVQNSDFFAGMLPTLAVVGGNNQTSSANLFLPAPLVVFVSAANGAPISNAPITFSVIQGDATLATSFTSARFSTVPVRTSGDGLATIFCHLGAAGVVNFIRATAVSGSNSASVTFTEVAVPAQAGGVTLQGDPSSPALNATVDMKPIGVQENQIEDGVIMTRVQVVIDPDATVGQINSVLSMINGGIVTMQPGSPFMTLAIPPQPNGGRLKNLVQALASTPGVFFAFPAHELRAQIFPYDDPISTPSLVALFHLLPTHFPAAWNASGLLTGCQANPVKMLIVDRFQTAPPTAPLNFGGQIPLFHLSDPDPDPNGKEEHGYMVAATAGALFDKLVPTGANPFSGCLDFRLIQTRGLDADEVIQRFADNMPAGEFIVNQSMGLQGYCSNSCNPADVELEIPGAMQRAALALHWRGLTKDRWGDFFMAVAAGNDRNKILAPIYPAISLAAYKSEPIIATLPSQTFTFVQDDSLWAPNSGFANYPSLTATPDEVTKLSILLTRLRAGVFEPADNILSVGSIDSDFTPATVAESDFSNTGPDVKAVGRDVTVGCPGQTPGFSCTMVDGTSFSSPEVAGLASYLWLLSSELRGRSPADTVETIRANTRDNSKTTDIIDAYAAVLALDQPILPTPTTAKVRAAILDVNGDGVFDEKDVQLYLDNYFVGGLPVSPGLPDSSRFDLNGDGFTGGSTVDRFDLDRVGSTQFGITCYSNVSQKIEGIPTDFDETSLTDLQILCYSAYSGLYTGDPTARSNLLADVCTPGVAVAIFPEGASLAPGEAQQFFAGISGVEDQRIRWSVLPPQGGTITQDGLFTPNCTPTNGSTSVFTIRASSVAFPFKFDEVHVAVTLPLVVTSTTVTAGSVFRGSPGASQCGTGSDCLDDGPDPAKFPDGPNFVCSSEPCTCVNASPDSQIHFEWDVAASSISLAEALETVRYTARRATTVSATVNRSWGTGSTRVSATMSGAFAGQTAYEISNGQVTTDTTLPSFSLAQGSVLDISLDGRCSGNSAGSGTAVTLNFTPMTTGTFELAPAVTSVSVLAPINYAFTWTVPSPFNWHHLNQLHFRIRDNNDVLIWIRFNESDRTFSVFNEAARSFGPAVPAGSHRRLEASSAILEMARTSVVATGPTSPTVTLNLGLNFKPQTAGHTYVVEIAASDDDGHADDFIPAGFLTITPFH